MSARPDDLTEIATTAAVALSTEAGQRLVSLLVERELAAAAPAGADGLALARLEGRRDLVLALLTWRETGLAGEPRSPRGAVRNLILKLTGE